MAKKKKNLMMPFITSKEHPAKPGETDAAFWPEYCREEPEFFVNAPKTYDDEGVIEERFSPKFSSKYNKCTPDLQQRIKSLINAAKKLSSRHYSTNKPDYRIKLDVVYCTIEIFPTIKEIKVFLRVERLNLKSNIVKIEEADAYYTGGPAKWIVFKISSPEQDVEALRLIKECYEYKKNYIRALKG